MALPHLCVGSLGVLGTGVYLSASVLVGITEPSAKGKFKGFFSKSTVLTTVWVSGANRDSLDPDSVVMNSFSPAQHEARTRLRTRALRAKGQLSLWLHNEGVAGSALQPRGHDCRGAAPPPLLRSSLGLPMPGLMGTDSPWPRWPLPTPTSALQCACLLLPLPEVAWKQGLCPALLRPLVGQGPRSWGCWAGLHTLPAHSRGPLWGLPTPTVPDRPGHSQGTEHSKQPVPPARVLSSSGQSRLRDLCQGPGTVSLSW